METRFGVRLLGAMLDDSNMKKMLRFATHSMEKCVCLYKRPNIVDETLGSTDMKPVERFATIHSRRGPLAVGAGVEFCYQSSDSFMALNEEATQDSASSSHEALAVTEKAQRDSDASANIGTVDCDEGHGVVATFA